MMDHTPNQNDAIAEFCQVCDLEDVEIAERYLLNNDWNIDAAIEQYIDENGEVDETGGSGSAKAEESSASTSGPRTLSGRPVPTETPLSSSSSKATQSKPKAKKKFASLKDLQGDNGGTGGGQDDDSDRDQEYFAGGDKSGLAVQEPGTAPKDNGVQRLLETARRNGPPPPRESSPPPSAFAGAGQTLGGDDTPSKVIPDPNANAPRPPRMVQRTLHLWADGFSVDDGPLYRYDDPRNARTLDMINRGSAPLDIMNVEAGQAVDVNLEQHRSDNYVQPKKKYTPFGSGGHRLGSPTPAASSSFSSPAPSTAPIAPTAPSSTTAAPEVDETQPVITLQVRLADGTRLPARFNGTHTIGDVYNFVDRASPAAQQRAYVLATTFPTKELSEKEAVLGDMAEFKRGGVIVQKWQ